MGKGLAWCAVVQIILTLLRMVLRSLWTRYSTEDHLKFVHKYVGIEDQPPQNAYLDVTFRWLQFGMSITTVLLWVYKTYAWHVSTTVNILELIMCYPHPLPGSLFILCAPSGEASNTPCHVHTHRCSSVFALLFSPPE